MNNYKYFLSIFTLLTILSLFIIDEKFLYAISAIMFFPFLFIFFAKIFKLDFYIYLIIAIIFIFPSNDSSFLPITMNSAIAFSLFILISIIYFLFIKIRKEPFYLGDRKIFYLMIVLFFACLYGFAEGYKVKTIIQVMTKYALLSSYYIFYDWLYKLYHKKDIKYEESLFFKKITSFC